jgi:hypothetical protein
MKKMLLLCSLLLCQVGCEQNPACSTSSAQNQEATATSSTVQPCPIPENQVPESSTSETAVSESSFDHQDSAFIPLEVQVTYSNFDSQDEQKVEKALEIIKKVVASEEFKERVINFEYKGQKSFVDNGGLTNEQIYLAILEGKENLKPEADHEMDLELELYYSWKNTVGYTYPDELTIYMNRKFFNRYSPAEVAGNIFHEWTHKLGFEHAFRYSVSRDSSVPYALGYLMEELGRQYE